MSRPLLVIGLDGLDPELLRGFLAEEALPHLAPLLGARSIELEPGDERWSGLAWEQFTAGRPEATRRRSSTVGFDPATYAVGQPTSRTLPFTAGLDVPVVAFDVPYFDLVPGEARGLGAWGAHDPGVARHSVPKDLVDEVTQRFGPYPAPTWIYGFTWPDAEATKRMGLDLARAVDVRAEVARWLLGTRLPGWKLGLVVIGELHGAVEALWHGVDPAHPLAGHASAPVAREALRQIVRAMDRFVGRLMAAFPEADVVAFVPHGMGTNHADVPAMLLMPELLLRHETGERAYEPPAGGIPGEDAPWPEGLDWSATVLRHFRAPRASRQGLRRRRVPDTRDGRGRELAWMPAARYRGAWSRMRAFALPSFYDSRIRLNVIGREAAGRVRPREAASVLDDLEALLAETRDPTTGRAVEVRVARAPVDALLERPPDDADLVVGWPRRTHVLEHPRHGRIGPAPWRRTGGHTGGTGRLAVLGGDVDDLPTRLGAPDTVSAWALRHLHAAPRGAARASGG
ncbi:MAG: hypothetical protein AB7T63_05655 [Planctomycetota bacterium]